MVIIAVALAAFLLCFAGTASASLAQIQRSQVVDTYEAVWQGIDETDLIPLPELWTAHVCFNPKEGFIPRSIAHVR